MNKQIYSKNIFIKKKNFKNSEYACRYESQEGQSITETVTARDERTARKKFVMLLKTKYSHYFILPAYVYTPEEERDIMEFVRVRANLLEAIDRLRLDRRTESSMLEEIPAYMDGMTEDEARRYTARLNELSYRLSHVNLQSFDSYVNGRMINTVTSLEQEINRFLTTTDNHLEGVA